MMVVMRADATEEQIKHVIDKITGVGAIAHPSSGKYRTVIGAIGDRQEISKLPFKAMPGVEDVLPISKPYKLVSREFKGEDTEIKIGNSVIGGNHFTVIAGPCSVETQDQMSLTATSVKKAGALLMRGGAFKPRTSPYSFQGLGEEGLKMLVQAREETGLPVVTEVLDPRDIDIVAENADVLQIGARNMQNFLLLTEAGKTKKPVLLKKGFGNTVEDLLMAAEYIAKAGNEKIILCERGIRTFENATRNTLDISCIPLLKQLSHLPVMVDPSHATGNRDLIEPLSMAALAAGAHGVMIEVHPTPEAALCDGPQSVDVAQFEKIMKKLIPMAEYLGREVS